MCTTAVPKCKRFTDTVYSDTAISCGVFRGAVTKLVNMIQSAADRREAGDLGGVARGLLCAVASSPPALAAQEPTRDRERKERDRDPNRLAQHEAVHESGLGVLRKDAKEVARRVGACLVKPRVHSLQPDGVDVTFRACMSQIREPETM